MALSLAVVAIAGVFLAVRTNFDPASGPARLIFGFEAVIAPSFADIFYANCMKIGLLALILPEPDCRAVAEAGAARIDLDDQTVDSAAGVVRFEIDYKT